MRCSLKTSQHEDDQLQRPLGGSPTAEKTHTCYKDRGKNRAADFSSSFSVHGVSLIYL